jgi:putative pyruvate formate lyase activating enzyme
MGEEPELVPSHTVFFTGCTLACAYCQNWDIATRPDAGAPVGPARLARTIGCRHDQGSRNVNFVGGDPAPHIATILATLVELEAGVPVVFNSNMYLSDTALRLLDGVVDVYLADFRYGNDECARRLSSVPRYFETVAEAFIEADRQTDVMLRHLVLPGHLECCTEPIMAWVREHMPAVYFNLMFQYRPCHHAGDYPELRRSLTEDEVRAAARLAADYGVCWRT